MHCVAGAETVAEVNAVEASIAAQSAELVQAAADSVQASNAAGERSELTVTSDSSMGHKC